MSHAMGAVAAPDVRFQSLSEREWRVSDARRDAGDADSVLGFVERSADNRFQLLELGNGHGVTCTVFESLAAVRDYFVRGS